MPLKRTTTLQKPKSQLSASTDGTVINGLEAFDASGDGQLFQELTTRYYITTEELSVVNLIIAYGSKYCVGIVYSNDVHYELQGFCLNKFERTFCKVYEGEYVKMN